MANPLKYRLSYGDGLTDTFDKWENAMGQLKYLLNQGYSEVRVSMVIM